MNKQKKDIKPINPDNLTPEEPSPKPQFEQTPDSSNSLQKKPDRPERPERPERPDRLDRSVRSSDRPYRSDKPRKPFRSDDRKSFEPPAEITVSSEERAALTWLMVGQLGLKSDGRIYPVLKLNQPDNQWPPKTWKELVKKKLAIPHTWDGEPYAVSLTRRGYQIVTNPEPIEPSPSLEPSLEPTSPSEHESPTPNTD